MFPGVFGDALDPAAFGLLGVVPFGLGVGVGVADPPVPELVDVP